MLCKISLRFCVLMCALHVALCAGCSGETSKAPKLVPAKGAVKYQGKPIVAATVLFNPTDGTPAMGMTDNEGNFTVTTGGRPGALIGKHKVIITKASTGADGKSRTDMKPQDMEKMVKEGVSFAPPKSEFPVRYTTLSGTNLEADVSADPASNVFEFNLVD